MVTAGLGKCDITPPVGAWLTGYAGRPGPSTGVHDALEAQALVLESGGARAALICADLLIFDDEVIERILAALGAEAGLTASNVLFCASHTHAGPATWGIHGMGALDREYLGSVAEKIAAMATRAAQRMVPVRVGAGRSEVRIGVNRRLRTEHGVALEPDPSKPIDADLSVLRIDDQGGKPACILFDHACHGVVLTEQNTLISADWIGYARREVERRFPGATVMFAQGCCADINPSERGTFEAAQRTGETVAEAVALLVPGIRTAPAERVQAASVPFEMPLLPLPPVEEARKELTEANRRVSDLEEQGAPIGHRNGALAMQAWAQRLMQAIERGGAPPMRSRVTAIALDGIALVGLPAEVFAEIGMRVRAASPFAHTFSIAYANRVLGYIPTQAEYQQGGYEVDGAYKYYGIARVAPTAQETLERAAAQALASIRG